MMPKTRNNPMSPRNGHNREEGFFRLVLGGFFLREALVALLLLAIGRFGIGISSFLRGKPLKNLHTLQDLQGPFQLGIEDPLAPFLWLLPLLFRFYLLQMAL